MPLMMLLSKPPCAIIKSTRKLKLRLFVLYDPHPRWSKPVLPVGVEGADLFDTIPALRSMMQRDSPIDRLYAWVGFHERFDKDHSHGWLAAKLLVRKLATIQYVLATKGAFYDRVVWADADVSISRRFDQPFFQFVLKHDVVYCPFNGYSRSSSNYQWEQPSIKWKSSRVWTWHVESGLMVFATNARTLAFASAATELYEGGMLRLRHKCEQLGERCPHFARFNQFGNDIYLWPIVAHMAMSPTWRALLRGTLCCLDAEAIVPNVTQGWFPWHTNTLAPNYTHWTAPFRLEQYAFHYMLNGPYSIRRNKADDRRPELLEGDFTQRERWFNASSLLHKLSVSSRWRELPWDTEEFGVPLRPRIATCGCMPSGRTS